MAAILASHSCCCRIGQLIHHGKLGDNLTFSSSLVNYNYSELDNDVKDLVKPRKLPRFQVEMQERELPAKPGPNGRVIKMVPTTEIRKRMSPSISTPEIVNGSVKNVNGVNVVKGGSLVKKDPTPPLLRSPRAKELPPVEGPNVLPSDEGFSWANENYNSVQRTIDVWSFVIALRVRVLLDNAKWTYIGGFTDDKQVVLLRHGIHVKFLLELGSAGSNNQMTHVITLEM